MGGEFIVKPPLIISELCLRFDSKIIKLIREGPKVVNPMKETLDERAISEVLDGADAAIYNIGLLREFPARGVRLRELHFEAARRVMGSAVRSGVKRFVLMSANGVNAQGTTYQRTKYMAEEYLKTTGLDWMIFRPSVIFGDPRGRTEFATRLYREILCSPLPAPVWGVRSEQFGLSGFWAPGERRRARLITRCLAAAAVIDC